MLARHIAQACGRVQIVGLCILLRVIKGRICSLRGSGGQNDEGVRETKSGGTLISLAFLRLVRIKSKLAISRTEPIILTG